VELSSSRFHGHNGRDSYTVAEHLGNELWLDGLRLMVKTRTA
jgi:hypothetical protein